MWAKVLNGTYLLQEELDNIYGKGKTLDIGLRVVVKVSINEID